MCLIEFEILSYIYVLWLYWGHDYYSVHEEDTLICELQLDKLMNCWNSSISLRKPVSSIAEILLLVFQYNLVSSLSSSVERFLFVSFCLISLVFSYASQLLKIFITSRGLSRYSKFCLRTSWVKLLFGKTARLLCFLSKMHSIEFERVYNGLVLGFYIFLLKSSFSNFGLKLI